MKEIWKDIDGYEGIYQVSSFGRVKSLDRIDCSNRHIKSKILKLGKLHHGYICTLSKNGKSKSYHISKLVVYHFLDFKNGKWINHKNGNPFDNRLHNLELWNSRNNKGKQHYNFGKRGCESSNSKEILQYSLNGDFIKKFPSISEAAIELNLNVNSLYDVLSDNKNVYCGFIWKRVK